MAFALPVWFAVQDEFLGPDDAARAAPSCFDRFDDAALFQMLHLTRPCVAFIADAVRASVSAADGPALPADDTVMVALSYYAHGAPSAAELQRVGLFQAEAAVNAVSAVLAGMCDQFVSFPRTRDAKARVASRAEGLCGIPGVLGVLAPAHFRIRASPYEKSSFRSFVNSLGYTSVASQIICDSDGNITAVEECCVGSTYEQDMWGSSLRGREIELDLHGPYWVVGGRGYHLSKHVLTPVSEPANDSETRFNEAHAKIHNVMRTTLGSMKRRFRCLMQLGFTKEGSLDKKSNIIKATCVLHNIAKKFSVPPPPIDGKIEALLPGKQHLVPSEINPEALKARQMLIEGNFSVGSGSQDLVNNSTDEKVSAEERRRVSTSAFLCSHSVSTVIFGSIPEPMQ